MAEKYALPVVYKKAGQDLVVNDICSADPITGLALKDDLGNLRAYYPSHINAGCSGDFAELASYKYARSESNPYVYYIDSDYGPGMEIEIPSDTETVIPNNAAVILLPTGETDPGYFDGTDIFVTSESDKFDILIRMKAIAEFSNKNLTLRMKINTTNEIVFEKTIPLPQAAGYQTSISENFIYTGSADFLANGAKIYLESDSDIEISSAQYLVTKLV